jgi:hypothetical protein
MAKSSKLSQLTKPGLPGSYAIPAGEHDGTFYGPGQMASGAVPPAASAEAPANPAVEGAKAGPKS